MKGVVRKREEEKISLREMTNFQGCGGSERKGDLAALGDEPLGPTPAIQKAQLCAGLTGLAEARGRKNLAARDNEPPRLWRKWQDSNL